tara:strand:- start:7109 stop:7837 length:729 start_codon:yes stop_codon:yes gene_type:complete
MKIKELSIIFPIYNEQDRLRKNLLKIANLFQTFRSTNIEIVLVNDGSTDNTHDLINKFLKSLNYKNKKRVKYINYNNNKGKGYALKQGILKSKMKWKLTCDIDFSAHPVEVKKWFKYNYIKNSKSCYFASRSLKKSNVKYKHHRYYLGNIFNYFVSIIFNLKIGDTQCGFKLYHSSYARKIFYKMSEFRYSHDVEIAVLLRKNFIKVYELPIKWIHRDKSKLNILTDGLNMISKLIFIRLRH